MLVAYEGLGSDCHDQKITLVDITVYFCYGISNGRFLETVVRSVFEMLSSVMK